MFRAKIPKMPKVFQCAICKRTLLGGTYTLIKHFEQCKRKPKSQVKEKEMSCPIPIDMDVRKHWKDHNLVTDSMANWLREACGCEAHEGLMDVSDEYYFNVFKTHIPEGKSCWQKVDRRYGAFQPLARNKIAALLVFTDVNGRNATPMLNIHST